MTNVEVLKIDFTERYLVTSDQRTLPIAHLFDVRGHETQDARRAVLCIAGDPGSWLSVRLADYAKASLQ
jgi:hypothetical protein